MSSEKTKPLWGSLREITLTENISQFVTKKTFNLIDIGCGDGYLLYHLNKKLKCNLYGLDLNKERLQRIKNRLPFVKTIKGDITKLPFETNKFEVVICSEVLEHIPNFKKAFDELIRVTKKELVITVPNDQPLIKTICPDCGKGCYVDGHIHRFCLRDFKELVKEKTNVKIIQIKKFHTIYSYNKLTLKFPKLFRLILDQSITFLEDIVPFFKPNYLLIKIVKK